MSPTALRVAARYAATLQDPLQRALEEVGKRHRFTKVDLRTALGGEPLDMRRIQQLVRSGYLALDNGGYSVTDLGWTWIHGGVRTAARLRVVSLPLRMPDPAKAVTSQELARQGVHV